MRAHLLIAIVALLIACPVAATAKTLRMAYDLDPTSLDPHEQLSGATLQMSHLLFDPLIRFKQDLTIEPRLAKSYETIDDRTTRFHLPRKREVPVRPHTFSERRGVDGSTA